MYDYITDLFVKERHGESAAALRERRGKFASVVGVLANVLLSASKIAAGIIAGSIAIIGDAVNNLSDIFSYLISYISFRVSSRPADREHPFGHARFEYVASLFVSFIIIVVAYRLFVSSIERIGGDGIAVYPAIAIVFLAVSVVIKLWLYFFYRRLAVRTDSTVLRASAADCISDVLSTSIILTSVILGKLFGWNTDGYMGVLVAGFILYSAFRIIHESMDRILGSSDSEGIKAGIIRIAAAHPEVIDVHDIIIHDYGPGTCFCSLHAEVSEKLSITDAHSIADSIERSLEEDLGVACTVHIDPIENDSPEYETAKERIIKALNESGCGIGVHDLRLVHGADRITLVFDIAVPFEIKIPQKELIRKLSEKLSAYPEHYVLSVTIDRQ